MFLGKLYIVATPIGNLADITLRAIETLKGVDVILAEDTRHSRTLLQHYQINKPLWALHEHNEQQMAEKIIERCQQGESFALISDAGTPLMSDPGFHLVRAMQQHQLPVIAIPGPCALVAALSVAGLPTDRFCFLGFLPAKSSGRKEKLQVLENETMTAILYEAPHRIVDCVQDIGEVLGQDRLIVLVKEITKPFETVKHGTSTELQEWFEQDSLRQKGEFVVLIAGKITQPDADYGTILDNKTILQQLLTEVSIKQAVSLAVKLTGQKKNELYALALQLKGEGLS
jgi:16S rRNA (cytidine1402-2'-O)-methyltransferase